MKKIILMALLCAPMTMFAQKFGHINSQEIMTSMPEFSIAQGEIQAKAKEFENEMTEMQQELQRKAAEFEKVRQTLPQTKQQETETELQGLYTKLQQANQDYQQQLQKLQQEKLQPIQSKLMNAITAVGKTGNYVYIMDLSMGIPYINDALSEDVTAKVKAELKK